MGAAGPTRSDSPDGVVFAAATSACRIEGSRFGGAGTSHRDAWAAAPGTTTCGETADTARDPHHRFAGDLDVARDANLGTWCVSTPWARVQSEGCALAPRPPPVVTDTGMANGEPEAAADVDAGAWTALLVRHLYTAPRAIVDRVPPEDHFTGAMRDTFEPAHGHARRFGPVRTGATTLARTPRASYRAVAEALAEGR